MGISFRNGTRYGGISRNNGLGATASSPPKRVIYCVHGKPRAGCCKVLEGEVIDVDSAELDITKHAKENSDTTNMSKTLTFHAGVS